jgi:hypothetical protein
MTEIISAAKPALVNLEGKPKKYSRRTGSSG